MIDDYAGELHKEFSKMFDGMHIGMSIASNDDGIIYSVFYNAGVIITYGYLKLTNPRLKEELYGIANRQLNDYKNEKLQELFDELNSIKQLSNRSKYEWPNT